MKQTIITITKDNLIAEIINPKAKETVLMRDVFEWQKIGLIKSLQQALDSTKEKKSIRILLADEFYYLVGLELNKKFENNRAEIRELAEENIPENLQKVGWDFGLVSKNDESVYIQCFALTSFANQQLSELLNQVDIKVDVIEPYALALIQSYKSNNDSFLLIHNEEITSLALIVQNGMVIFSKSFNLKNFNQEVSDLISFSKKFYQLKLPKLVLSGIKKSTASEFVKSIKVEEVEIEANLNLALKTEIKGKDSKILNLSGEKLSLPIETDDDQKPNLNQDQDQKTEIDVETNDVRPAVIEHKKKVKNFSFVLIMIAIIGIVLGVVSSFFVINFL